MSETIAFNNNNKGERCDRYPFAIEDVDSNTNARLLEQFTGYFSNSALNKI